MWYNFIIIQIVLGFTIFAGFTKRACEDADQLKEEGTGRITILQLDVTSERQVRSPTKRCSFREEYFKVFACSQWLSIFINVSRSGLLPSKQ